MSLVISKLECVADESKKQILKGVNLTIGENEIHFLMGKNGSGKSTLSKVIMGHPSYAVSNGNIVLDNKDITHIATNERACAGVFLAFQHPIEVPGVNFANFLRLSYNAINKTSTPVFKFRKLLKENCDLLHMSDDFLNRNLNEDLSGGEKKKNEILQMAVLKPKYVILDEIDSGLDIDALKEVFNAINILQKKMKFGLLIITHYTNILEYIRPDKVHIMKNGEIISSGDVKLISKIAKEGYTIFD